MKHKDDCPVWDHGEWEIYCDCTCDNGSRRLSMGKAEREKGKRRERWLVKELKGIGLDAVRSGQYAARPGISSDVYCTDSRFTFESKDRKALGVFPAVDKMLSEADPFDWPILVWYNPKYRRAVAVVAWGDMKRIIEECNDGQHAA